MPRGNTEIPQTSRPDSIQPNRERTPGLFKQGGWSEEEDADQRQTCVCVCVCVFTVCVCQVTLVCVCLVSPALCVRFITKRFIGEYDHKKGKYVRKRYLTPRKSTRCFQVKRGRVSPQR